MACLLLVGEGCLAENLPPVVVQPSTDWAAQGLAAQSAGQHDEAVRLLTLAYEQAVSDHGEASNPALVLAQHIGKAYQTLGQHTQQLRWDERAMRQSLALHGPTHRQTLQAILDLAQTYVDIGQERTGLRLAQSATESARRHLGADDAVTQQAYSTLANALTFMRRSEEALRYDRLALASRRRSLSPGNPLIESSMNNLAASLGNAGHYAESVTLSRQVLALRQARLGASAHATLVSATGLAESLVLVGRNAEAVALAKRTLALRQAYFGPYHRDTLNTQFVYVNALHDLGRKQDALAAARDGAAAIEGRLRMPGLTTADRQGLLSTYVADMQAYARWHGEAGPPYWTNGFELAEKVKARGMVETLQQRQQLQRADLPQAQQNRLRQLETEMVALDANIAKHGLGDLAQQSLAASELLRRRELELELGGLLLASGEATVNAGDGPAAAVLSSDEAYISWLLDADGRLQAWVLRPDGRLRFFGLGMSPDLPGDIQQLRTAYLARAKPTRQEALTQRLARQLIRPLLPDLRDVKHWIMAPDGALALLPIEALLHHEFRRIGRALPTHSRVQSLATLRVLKARSRDYAAAGDRKSLLALGDATYDDGGGQPAQRGHDRGWRLRRSGAGADQGPTRNELGALQWRNIPGTGQEVDAVARLWRSARPAAAADDVQVFKGADASEATLRALNATGELAGFRYLHLAAHGYLSSEPALSAVVLSQQHLHEGEDGYITAAEWPSFRLRSDVAVVSACDSGNGVTLPGEGVLGLPYALAAAGNVSAVLALWPVDDAASVEFVSRFFAGLAAGATPPRALADAREGLRRTPRWSAPRYWAPWVLYGP